MTQDSLGTVHTRVRPFPSPFEIGYEPGAFLPLYDRYDGSYFYPSPSATAAHCVNFWMNVEIPDWIISNVTAVYITKREELIDKDMVAVMEAWSNDWAVKNPGPGKMNARAKEERNVKYRTEHEAHRLSVLPSVEAKRPLSIDPLDARQIVRVYQMTANRPSPKRFPEEEKLLLDQLVELSSGTSMIRNIYNTYDLLEIGRVFTGKYKPDAGMTVVEAIQQTNILVAGINQEIVRQDIARSY